jgi:hypothetical protein
VAEKFRVTDADRAYMRRLGAFMAEANEESAREHRSLDGPERLARSEKLSEWGREHANIGDRIDDEPWKLFERARELGLIRKR